MCSGISHAHKQNVTISKPIKWTCIGLFHPEKKILSYRNECQNCKLNHLILTHAIYFIRMSSLYDELLICQHWFKKSFNAGSSHIFLKLYSSMSRKKKQSIWRFPAGYSRYCVPLLWITVTLIAVPWPFIAVPWPLKFGTLCASILLICGTLLNAYFSNADFWI